MNSPDQNPSGEAVTADTPPAGETISVVIPARNEAGSIGEVVTGVRQQLPDAEILVVDDGSTDHTATVARQAGARVLRHVYGMGNGAAIKSGAREARGGILVFMDGDGQHRPEDIPRLLAPLAEGYEMVVGAREPRSHASWGRRLANAFYNRLASYMTGHPVLDLTSGFRAARARHFRQFLYLLPNGFSYPTTSTMAFFRAGLPVGYVPIQARKRRGSSHIRLLRDGMRFLLIITKIGALFSPMRFFLPVSLALFLLGTGYYAYTFATWHRLTNMTVILWLSALFTFLISMVSEQVSSLHYHGIEQRQRRLVRTPPQPEEGEG